MGYLRASCEVVAHPTGAGGDAALARGCRAACALPACALPTQAVVEHNTNVVVQPFTLCIVQQWRFQNKVGARLPLASAYAARAPEMLLKDASDKPPATNLVLNSQQS